MEAKYYQVNNGIAYDTQLKSFRIFHKLMHKKRVILEHNIDLYSEVDLSAFVYRLFHEDFSSIDGIQSTGKKSS